MAKLLGDDRLQRFTQRGEGGLATREEARLERALETRIARSWTVYRASPAKEGTQRRSVI